MKILKAFTVLAFLAVAVLSFSTMTKEEVSDVETAEEQAQKHPSQAEMQQIMSMYSEPDTLVRKLAQVGLLVNSIEDSPIAGFKHAFTDRGLFYASEDGQFLMRATIYDLKNGNQNVTETVMKTKRVEGVEKFKDSMVVFPAENEKHRITVFTDATCGYCQKLHHEIKSYNDLGITVQYLAYPRGGQTSFQLMTHIWCSDDKKQEMTKLKKEIMMLQGKPYSPPELKSCDAPIIAQHSLGVSIGVSGTPAIILADGTLVGGYVPAPALIEQL